MTPPRPDPLIAALLVVLASALIAATTLLAKALGTGALGPALHPLQVTHGRFLFGLLGIAAAAAVFRPRFTLPRLPLHLVRTLCGAAGVTLMFTAAARIPLSDATAISFLNPIFCMILAIPLLGERVGPWRWVAAAVALAGAMILIRPGAAAFQPAALFALAAAAVLGAEMVLIKRLAGREGPFQILLVNNCLGWMIVGTLAIPVWIQPTPGQWMAMAALGFAMAGAQAAYVHAMARADASFVTPFSYLTLIFAAVYDAAVFGVLPGAVSVLGAGVILAGAALLAWREGRRPGRLPPDPAPLVAGRRGTGRHG